MSGARVPAPAWLVPAMTMSRTTLLRFPRLIGSSTLSRSTQARRLFQNSNCHSLHLCQFLTSFSLYTRNFCVLCFVDTQAYTGCMLVLEQTTIYIDVSVQVNSTHPGQRSVFLLTFSLLPSDKREWSLGVCVWTPGTALLFLTFVVYIRHLLG
jgi:hypothetical protein